jgi:hypothetical protein
VSVGGAANDTPWNGALEEKYVSRKLTLAAILAVVLAPRLGWGQAMTGSGTNNSVPKFTGSSTVGNSDIFDANGQVGVNTTTPHSALDVNGTLTVEAGRSIFFGNEVCCGAGPTGSSLGSSAGWSPFYNGVFLNANGTGDGDGVVGAQVNTTLPCWRRALGSGLHEWPGGDNFVIARVAPGANYQAPSILFSVDSTGRAKVTGGLTFPDGSVQTTATLVGPAGPTGATGATGATGPAGPAVHTSAACAGGTNVAQPRCGGGYAVSPFPGPCAVTSDTGSCQEVTGWCAVCKP